MKKIKEISIFNIINVITRITLEFMLMFIWIRYFVQNLTLSITISGLLVIFLEIILYCLKRKNIIKNTKKRETIKKIEDISTTFLFSDDKENVNFFYKLAKSTHTAKKLSKYIIIQNEFSTVALIPFYTYNNFSCDNLIYCLNLTKEQNPTKLVICTNQIDPKAQKLATHFKDTKICILDKTQTYENLLIPYNIFPEIKSVYTTPTKPTFGEILSISLNKKRSRGYFLASLILLFSSLIVRRNIYYVIMSSLLLLLTLISFLNPKFNKNQTSSPLD